MYNEVYVVYTAIIILPLSVLRIYLYSTPMVITIFHIFGVRRHSARPPNEPNSTYSVCVNMLMLCTTLMVG